MKCCGYCKSQLDSLPYNCRRCGGCYCGKHRLPENHSCSGLKRGNIYKNNGRKRNNIHKVNQKYNNSRHKSRQRNGGRKMDNGITRTICSRIRRKTTLIITFLIAVGISFLSTNMNYESMFMISDIAWVVFDVFLLKGLFMYVNKLNLINDLSIWLLRLCGAILSGVGLVGGYFFYATGGIVSNAYISGLGIVFLGFFVLGAFIAFRTRRRYEKTYYVG